MSTPSALIADRYRLVRLLGAGGMGVVWQAWDEKLQRPVALKMLRTQPELTDAERQMATDRAMREARITAGLHHPHAVTVFDVVEHEGQPCIVMQLIESTPLSELLREHGTLSPSETARIGAEVASALAAAHKLRIVHRDIKPGNILITSDGSAMISDFGISHALGDTTITATGLIHGTPAYLAPEAARGLPTSFASDVFSLGSTLYAMIEGEPPFGTERNAIALLHKVARGGYPAPKHAGPLTPLLRSMLATQPKRRPSMTDVTASLSALTDGAKAGAAVAASALRVAYDQTTQRIEDVPPAPATDAATTERIEDLPAASATDAATTEPIEDVPAGPATDAATTEGIADAAPAIATIPFDDPARPSASAAAMSASAAAMSAAAVARVAPDPMAETARVDRPTRYEPPTAETEPLGKGAVVLEREVAAAPASKMPSATETRSRTRRRAAVAVGILILLIALGVGAAFLFNPLRSTPQEASEPTPSATAPANSATPTPAAPSPQASATETPPPTEEPPAEEEPPPPATPEQRVVDTISGYYALMPEDRDNAWPLMTADYQENHAGGRGGYEAFWAGVSDVSVTDVTATGADSGQATLTYHFTDGRVVEEVTSYRFVDEDGVLKIAATEVLSSTAL